MPGRAQALAALCLWFAAGCGRGGPAVEGELKQWHRVTLTFDGPDTAETAAPNPFRDYRLDVTFESSGTRLVVPGFYAADGNAAETGADSGGRWRAHFTPGETGTWRYTASFRAGPDIALSEEPEAGEPAGFDGASGEFEVGPTDKRPPDMRGRGLLSYVGRRYLQFAGTKEYFLKGGADSPENFLAYEDFDGTWDADAVAGSENYGHVGSFIHRYAAHAADWREGDPTWRQGRGKNIVGALNYLASKQMNAVYFLTYNLDGGDGRDTWMWTDPEVRDRFDCSKLDQWEIVFSHMDSLGLMLHVVTQETENDQGLDGGELGPHRKLYYRELVARFGHHPALVWNLGEENTNTVDQLKAFAAYIRGLDAYRHPIVVHTYPRAWAAVYEPLLGFEHMEGASLQMANLLGAYELTSEWVARSRESGRPWFACIDEPGSGLEGIQPDSLNPTHDEERRQVLWPHLMAGGAGVEWYFGSKWPHMDINAEDWRSRDVLWDQTRHALEFFRQHLPFHEMEPCGERLAAGEGLCFGRGDGIYAVYLPDGGAAQLEVAAGEFAVGWYDPRNGGPLRTGSEEAVRGPGPVSIGRPPAEPGQDWAVLVTRR